MKNQIEIIDQMIERQEISIKQSEILRKHLTDPSQDPIQVAKNLGIFQESSKTRINRLLDEIIVSDVDGHIFTEAKSSVRSLLSKMMTKCKGSENPKDILQAIFEIF